MSKVLLILAVAICSTVRIGVTGFSSHPIIKKIHVTHFTSHKTDRLTISSQRKDCKQKFTALQLFSEEQSAALILAETESWRQYVPLVVSVGVIADILLGSPLANLALAPMRRAADGDEGEVDTEGDSGISTNRKSRINKPNERVDTDAIGKAAIEKAKNSMELQKFLEENKSDNDRYEEIRKKLDKMTDEFDSRKPL